MNTDWPQQHGRASFEALVDDPDRLGLLAEIGGELAGGLMGSYPELTPFVRLREARLNSLWVLPDHRGSGAGACSSTSSWTGRASAGRRTPW